MLSRVPCRCEKFEPMLLVGIAFGAFLINIPGAYDALMAGPANGQPGGLFWYLYKGVEWVIFPPLIFLGIGAMTDFGPLIANPKSLLLGAAAQVGIFLALLIALLIGFTPQEAGAIGIIGGADGPTAIYVTSRLAPNLMGPIAIAAYSYMALVPVIQPPIMKLLTTEKERKSAWNNFVPCRKRKNNVPDHRYGYRRYRASQCIAASRNVDARKPVQGIRRCAAPC